MYLTVWLYLAEKLLEVLIKISFIHLKQVIEKYNLPYRLNTNLSFPVSKKQW